MAISNLMATRTQLREQLEAANARISEMETEMEEAVRQRDDARGEASELAEALAMAQTQLEEANDELAQVERAYEALKSEQKSVPARAAEEVAKLGMGVEQLPEVVEEAELEEAEQKSEAELWEQYDALPEGPERREFYRRHRKILSPMAG